MSEVAEKLVQIGQLDSDPDIELVLLASANAIQRLVAERNALRSRVDNLERELTRLRDQSTLLHDCYRRLTTEFVTQFQLIDSAIGDLFREPIESAGARLSEQQPADEAAPNALQNSA
jgi:predicted nuclease with TOPRIM domain